MRTYIVTVRANPDHDDCLVEAEAEYQAENPELRGYDLRPRWFDSDREEVDLEVPAWWARENGLTE